MAKLLQNPDESFQIDNDDEAKELLLQLGMMGDFVKNPKIATETATQMATKFNHSTHYVIALFISGHSKPQDNGYMVYCLPKSKFTREQAVDFARDVSKEMGILFTVKPVDRNSARN